MTICIAAICNQHVILGAADKMLTSGDIEFEPAVSSKIFGITNSIVIMQAGDAGLQSEIAQTLGTLVNNRIKEHPDKWIVIKDAVALYMMIYNETQLKRIRGEILSPFGIDEQSFITRQKEMSEGFITDIASQMQRYKMPEIATIITGIDETGAHIFSLNNRSGTIRSNCCDSIGFAAVGSGGRHAQSQFMMAGHNRACLLHETLLLVYSAKKRSEVAPGVGRGTEMFTIGPQPGSLLPLTGVVELEKLDSIDKVVEAKQKRALKKAKQEVDEYVREIQRRAAEKQAKQTPEQPVQPPSTV